MKSLRILFAVLFAAVTTSTLQAQQPVIDSIDPPDWFVQLPDPMLLVHGSGLGQAKFSVEGVGVSLDHAQVSPNGHWAFLWIKTKDAPVQIVRVVALKPEGRAIHNWPLKPRTEPAEAHVGFTPADVIYLIMTDRFADGDPSNNRTAANPDGYDRSRPMSWHGGDFAGIEQHLDYLQELGVTALWTTPVTDNGSMPDSYHGYAATNLYDTDRHFGTLAEYQHLSAALHKRGIKLILDQVPNHIGVRHPWIADPPTPDWVHGTVASHIHAAGEFNDLIDPHAAPAATLALTTGWFVDAMPDMNQENPLVAQYLIQNALWWVETAQIDAIRIDTFPYVSRNFWRDYHAALHQAFPRLNTVGEVFNGDARITSYFAGGREQQGIDTGLDTPFDFPVFIAVREVLTKDKPMTDLAAVLRQDSLYPHPERLVHFFANHDTSRILTDAKGSLPRLRMALGLLATLRGTPELYSGDEIAMTGGPDPDNRHDFPGGFPALDASTHASAFKPAERTDDQRATFAYTAALFAARKAHPVLQGAPQQDLLADDTAFAFLRTASLAGCSAGSEAVLVVLNKSAQPRTLALPTANSALAGCTQFQPLAPAGAGSAALASGTLQIAVPADAIVLFTVR